MGTTAPGEQDLALLLLSSPPLGPPASALPALCTSSAASVCTNVVSGLGSNWPCIQP